MRLDKYITSCSGLSRKDAKSAISKGRVTVEGISDVRPETKVTEEQEIFLDGKPLLYEEFCYYMLNKPAGVVSATKDNRDATVVELISSEQPSELFPIGRLDKDTEGLLILTNDGLLAHQLLSPRYHVDKKYYVRLDKSVGEVEVSQFREGIDIGEKKLTKPAVLKPMGEKEAYVTISEGKFHQVKRMFQKVQRKVLYLKRVQMGELKLDEKLKIGEYRKLTEEEIKQLRKEV